MTLEKRGGKVVEQYPINSHMWALCMNKKNMIYLTGIVVWKGF